MKQKDIKRAFDQVKLHEKSKSKMLNNILSEAKEVKQKRTFTMKQVIFTIVMPLLLIGIGITTYFAIIKNNDEILIGKDNNGNNTNEIVIDDKDELPEIET